MDAQAHLASFLLFDTRDKAHSPAVNMTLSSSYNGDEHKKGGSGGLRE